MSRTARQVDRLDQVLLAAPRPDQALATDFAYRRIGAANHIARPDPTLAGITTQRTSGCPHDGRRP